MSFRPTVSYFVVFGILTALGLAWILRYEVWEKNTDSFAATTIAVLQHMEWVVVVGGAATYVGVEVFEMLAERFKRQQRMKGREEGRQEGKAEGRQEGEQELAKRLLNMSDAERKSEIERIANGDK